MLKLNAPPTTLAMRSPSRVQLGDALKAKAATALRPTGYFNAGQLDVKPALGVAGGGMASAPKKIDNGSRHFLQPPGDRDAMVASWVATEAAWEIPGGHRLAFRSEYLDSHGWSYVGPAPAEE